MEPTRTLEELINTDEPAWEMVQEWIKEATNHIEVLPASEPARSEALLQTQVTTRSPMGAIIYETGGILVDHGFIRILGSGHHEKMQRSLPGWNLQATQTEALGEAGFTLIADDAIGGFFALDGGAFSNPMRVFYLAPDTLYWEHMDIGYSEFVFSFCFTGNVEGFYDGLRWPNWKDEVENLSGDRVLNFYPPLWSNPPERPERMPNEERQRAPVPVAEQFLMTMNLREQLSQIPDDTEVEMNIE